jgi:hypothetical protein
MKNKKITLLLIIWLFQVLLTSCENNPSNAEQDAFASGDLDSTFFNQSSDSNSRIDSLKFIEELKREGWKLDQIENGILSPCYNFKPMYGTVENYLNVIVGGGTDVVIKLMNLQTNICTRYVFVNSNSSFRISNIPEGQYYLKIAYGKQWFSRVSDRVCIGKFTSATLYEKAEEILDFRLIQEPDGYSIPSYEVSLDVVSSGIQNSLSSDEISEEEFNR